MGNSNRRRKQELIKIYGPKCFIEELGLRKPSEIEEERKKYKGKKQLKIMDELTYHHILERCKGGKTTLENGAVLRNINHQWFNRQSPERQAEINKLFQEYKKKFPRISIVAAQITTEGIQKAEVIEFEEPEEELTVIPAYDMTEEDLKIYEEHKRKRNQRIFEKFKAGEER